jgi:hypothetical protein
VHHSCPVRWLLHIKRRHKAIRYAIGSAARSGMTRQRQVSLAKTGSIVVVMQMLQELGQIVALEDAFRDIVPNHLGIIMRDLVIGRSHGKN